MFNWLAHPCFLCVVYVCVCYTGANVDANASRDA